MSKAPAPTDSDERHHPLHEDQGAIAGRQKVDGHNLAWKLDLVLGGRADDTLLDTYQLEREPHVRFITEKAMEH